MRLKVRSFIVALALLASACGAVGKSPISPSVPGQVALSTVTWKATDGATVMPSGVITSPALGAGNFEVTVDLPREVGHKMSMTIWDVKGKSETTNPVTSTGTNYTVKTNCSLSGQPGDYTVRVEVLDTSPGGESVKTTLAVPVKLI